MDPNWHPQAQPKFFLNPLTLLTLETDSDKKDFKKKGVRERERDRETETETERKLRETKSQRLRESDWSG